MKTEQAPQVEVWQEEPQFTDGWGFHTIDPCICLMVRRFADLKQGCEIYFRRWEGDGLALPLPGIVAGRDGRIVEHWPRLPIRFPTLEAALEKARAFAAQPLPEFAEGFITQAAPTAPQQVAEVDHPSQLVKALILEHSDGRFEWRSFRYESLGRLQDGAPCEWDWARQNWARLNFATTLDSAIAAAQQELDTLFRAQSAATR